MIKMNFWLIALLINVFVAVLVLILTYDLAFTTVRVIKSMPNYSKRKTSFGEKLFSFLSTVAKSLIPIYNIITFYSRKYPYLPDFKFGYETFVGVHIFIIYLCDYESHPSRS